MIRMCLLIGAASVIAANPQVGPEYCIDYHPDCPIHEDENSTATHLPLYQDCHKFYKCDHGRACVFSCPTYNNGAGQLVFNPELQVCDYPWNVPGRPNCPNTSPTSTLTTSTPTTSTPSIDTSTTPGGNIPADCLKECPVNGTRRIRHPTKCIDYYQCVKGKPVLRQCLKNFYFNCYVEACDVLENLPKDYLCSDYKHRE